MWLRSVKRDIKFTLGIRPSEAVPIEEDASTAAESSLDVVPSAPAKKIKANSGLDECLGASTVVSLQASSESSDRMVAAMERLMKLSKLDDMTRSTKKKERKENGKGEGKGHGKRPTGPYLARTRLTEDLVTGEVVEWKGSFGWIKPHKQVDHPKAGAHRGRLYVHKVDLEWWVKSLTPGSYCRFHVYSDANSLGAEECTELKDESSQPSEAATSDEYSWQGYAGGYTGWQAGYWQQFGWMTSTWTEGEASRERSRSRKR